METLEIAICDDNAEVLPYIMEKVKRKFFQHEIPTTCQTFSNSQKLLERIQEKFFSLYFLDISMPRMDGFKLAEEIIEKQPGASIIFMSARAANIFQSFFASPIAFIRKENFLEDLEKAVEDFLERYSKKQETCYWIEDENGQSVPLEISQTLFLEAKNNGVHVSTVKQNFLIKNSLREMERSLKNHHFIKTHRSFLVNLAMIYQIKEDRVVLDNGVELPLSRSRSGKIKKKFVEYY